MRTLAVGGRPGHGRREVTVKCGLESPHRAPGPRPTGRHGGDMPRAQPGAQNRIRTEGEAPCRRTRFARGFDASKQIKRRKKEIAPLRRIIGGRAPAEAVGIGMRGHNRWLTDTERRRRGIGTRFHVHCMWLRPDFAACGPKTTPDGRHRGWTLPKTGRKHAERPAYVGSDQVLGHGLGF